jgi:VWFA-related protein
MRLRLAFVLLPLVPFASAFADAPPDEMLAPPSFEEAVEVNVVNVDVRATDSKGRPVTDLVKRDFELFEDGKRVEITNFAVVERGVSRARPEPARGQEESAAAVAEDAWTLVVYVDNFDIQAGHRARALRQVRDFLGRQLAPGDRVMVVSYDQGLKVRLPFTSDPAAVGAALTEMEGLAAHGPAIDLQRQQALREILMIQEAALTDPRQQTPCPLAIARPAHDFADARRDEVLRTLGALTVMVNSLSGVPGRKAVLHVSDGIPATPGEEVFQFLAEICGGGSGTGGIGRTAVVGGNNNAPEPEDESESSSSSADNGGRPGRPPLEPLDPLTVYDGLTLGPGAYKAASQAPIDAASYALGKELNALVGHANAQRVTLYMLQASGAERPAASEAGMGTGDRLFQFASIETAQRTSLQNSLTALASGTGGRTILNANDFGRDLYQMQEDFSSFYSLGFVPAHQGDGKEHRLEVRVRRKATQLRYRESYRDKPVLERAVDRTLAALFYGIEDNPLKIALDLGEQAPAPDGSYAVPVRLSIPLAKVAVLRGDGVYEGNLRVMVATRGADGRMSTVRQVPVPIRIPHKQVLTALGQLYVYTLTLQLPPGEQRVAVGVRDDVSANASYLSRAVTVGTAAAILRP